MVDPYFLIILCCSCFKGHSWTSLPVQWSRLHAPHAGGMGSIPDQGTRIPHAPSCHTAQPKFFKNNFKKQKATLMVHVHHSKKHISCETPTATPIAATGNHTPRETNEEV